MTKTLHLTVQIGEETVVPPYGDYLGLLHAKEPSIFDVWLGLLATRMTLEGRETDDVCRPKTGLIYDTWKRLS